MIGDGFSRRGLIATGLGAGLGASLAGDALLARAGPAQAATRILDAHAFGAVGDGIADDTRALQAALDAVFSEGGGMLLIPPGTYKVSETLRLIAEPGTTGNIGRQSGILGHGAHINSTIEGGNVLEILSRVTLRFFLIDGLDILGSGRDGNGVYIECDSGDNFFYNFCLRDLIVQHCGGDGCHLIGNVFEGQLMNSYFRGNGGNGATFAHGQHGGILSAIHVFGCVFGENAGHGAALANKCYDVAFHGCYLLLNGGFGLMAENGCTLLSNCGFENNHSRAGDFAHGDTGIALQNFGTLIGCTAYSVYYQTGLIRAFVAQSLTMIGCSGFGGGSAAAAKLAVIGGATGAVATLIGCTGTVERENGLEPIVISGQEHGGVVFGAAWNSRNLPRLGDYFLWVDSEGRLRLKKGLPQGDSDGALVGA